MRRLRNTILVMALSWSSFAMASVAAEHSESSLEGESLGTASLFAPSSPTAQHVMHGLLCQCPGCKPKRISIDECTCGYAAQQREEVVTILAAYDLSVPQGRAAAAQAVLDDQVRRYGRGVLAQPSSSMAWMLPLVAIIGGLGLVIVVARRWTRRSPGPAPQIAVEEEVFAEALDDALAQVD